MDHIDRFVQLREAALQTTGRTVRAYALVAVDDSGEVYHGANYGMSQTDRQQIHDQLTVMRRNVGSLLRNRVPCAG